MSQARECFGAGGLSLLLASWVLDLKMLAPFYFRGALEREEMKKCMFCLGEIPEKATFCMHCGKEQNRLDGLRQFSNVCFQLLGLLILLPFLVVAVIIIISIFSK